MFVLGGVIAGIIVTVRRVDPPGVTVFGVAARAAKSVVPPPPQTFGAVAEFRDAAGLMFEKSAELLSVS